MPNIKLNYLYRDAGNYKNFGSVVFTNNRDIALEHILDTLTLNLIESEFFDANRWQLPDLHFESWNVELDHGLHEFGGVDFTTEPASSNTDISNWLGRIEAT